VLLVGGLIEVRAEYSADGRPLAEAVRDEFDGE